MGGRRYRAPYIAQNIMVIPKAPIIRALSILRPRDTLLLLTISWKPSKKALSTNSWVGLGWQALNKTKPATMLRPPPLGLPSRKTFHLSEHECDLNLKMQLWEGKVFKFYHHNDLNLNFLVIPHMWITIPLSFELLSF